MNDFQKEIIYELVNIFARKINITNQDEINNIIDKLCSMDINDSIDYILVLLNDLLIRRIITKDDIYENAHFIIKLNQEKYNSVNDLIERLNYIKGMNMEYPSMPLSENHKLIIEAFDSFNKLINGKFDCYYTGGLMCYIATNRKLERYHGDLDLLINEQQLVDLKALVDSSDNFEFISNMEHKEVSGHEYKIVYKDTMMSIGLFLFERQADNSITTKEYYIEHKDGNRQIFVDEHHLSKNYTDMSYSNLIRYHNNYPYKMVSLERIYNAKKNLRPKDSHDAETIKNDIDMMIDYNLDVERKNNFDIRHKVCIQSVIHEIESSIKKENNKQHK